MAEDRPDPDQLLAKVEREEEEKTMGKLKIFLGYSAGVGKTYAMLEDAQMRRKRGTDVLIACVETHGRKETERLLEGLGSIPMKEVEHKGIMIKEVDLDAVIARRPQLVIIDELAHTNAPGSRHSKRYQDVLEIVEAGIDVFTTLNVQHLESLNDAVAQITGIKVKEIVPESVMDDADEIKIVDLPPKELMQRFREGKIYIPEQAAIAVDRFFNEGNLIALREMTLRRAAEHIDEQMLEYMQLRSIPGPWPVAETLMVCIGNDLALNEKLIRTTRRLADELRAEWYAIYVETPAHHRLSRFKKQQAIKGIELANSMGAKVHTTFGISVAREVISFARNNNVTRVIVGKHVRPKIQDFVLRSVTDDIVRASGPIDVMIITELRTKDQFVPKDKTLRKPFEKRTLFFAIWLVLGISLFGLGVNALGVEPVNLVLLYLLGVVISALTWGLGWAIFTSVLSALVFNLVFINPQLTFEIYDSQYFITLLAFVAVGIVISVLVVRARDYASAARRRDDYTSTLYALSVDLASVNEIPVALETISGHVQRACRCKSAYLLPSNDLLVVSYASKGLKLDEKELSAANWTFKQGLTSGKGTDTLSSAKLKYYPLRTPNGVVGVMGIASEEQEGILKLEQERLIQSFASLGALSIERIEFWNQLCTLALKGI